MISCSHTRAATFMIQFADSHDLTPPSAVFGILAPRVRPSSVGMWECSKALDLGVSATPTVPIMHGPPPPTITKGRARRSG